MTAMVAEVEFNAGGLRLAGKEWGRSDAQPVLALHGWLDNCASFDVLAPLLDNVHLIALDLAGHGKSDHRRAGAPYQIWQDVGDLYDVVEQLGWRQFSLLGHSRGAIISTLFAGTFPERVSHLALIDGIWATPVEPEQAPQQLRNAIEALRRDPVKASKIIPDIETAIRARQHGRLPVTEAMATLLVERGVKPVAGGYQWSTDPQLMLPSEVKFSKAHFAAFVKNITAKAHLIVANDGLQRFRQNYRDSLNQFPNIAVEELSGGHHLHMGDNVAAVANSVNRLFRQ